jgi:hypothetical protein
VYVLYFNGRSAAAYVLYVNMRTAGKPWRGNACAHGRSLAYSDAGLWARAGRRSSGLVLKLGTCALTVLGSYYSNRCL